MGRPPRPDSGRAELIDELITNFKLGVLAMQFLVAVRELSGPNNSPVLASDAADRAWGEGHPYKLIRRFLAVAESRGQGWASGDSDHLVVLSDKGRVYVDFARTFDGYDAGA